MSFENPNQDVLNMISARVMALDYKEDREGLSAEEDAERKRLDKKFIELGRRVPTDTVGYGSQSQTRDSIDPHGSSSPTMLRVFPDEKTALGFGHFLAAVGGNREAENRYEDLIGQPVFQSSHYEGNNTSGGYLVAPQFERSIVGLMREFGSFRANARVINCKTDSVYLPQRDSGLTTYFVDELGVIPPSVKQWKQLNLTLKKLAAIAVISNELSEDAMIAVADDLAFEMAHSAAMTEDRCGWLGDSSAADGSITGVIPKLIDSACADCIVTAGGAGWADYDLDDFCTALGRVHPTAHKRAAWYCSASFFGSVMCSLQAGAGGVTISDLQKGFGPSFLGLPVRFVEVLPRISGGSQHDCIVGDLSLSAIFATKPQMRLEKSTSATIDGQNLFERDASALRLCSRFDINVADVGTATEPSPLVVLRTV